MEHSVRAWMVSRWAPVQWTADAAPVASPEWRHATTTISECDLQGSDVLARGETVWINASRPDTVAAAWEWIEWRRGVVALTDPMCIASNLDLHDAQPPARTGNRALLLNQLVHELPWQVEVLRALGQTRALRRPYGTSPAAPALAHAGARLGMAA